jgi:hypothetical protein
VTCSVEEELKERRRQAGLSQSYGDLRNSLANSDSDPDPDSGELLESYGDEWKQVTEIINHLHHIFVKSMNKVRITVCDVLGGFSILG